MQPSGLRSRIAAPIDGERAAQTGLLGPDALSALRSPEELDSVGRENIDQCRHRAFPAVNVGIGRLQSLNGSDR